MTPEKNQQKNLEMLRQLNNPAQITLPIFEQYVEFVQRMYPTGGDGSEKLVMVLKIAKYSLKQRIAGKPLSADWLQNVKHGVRETIIMVERLHEAEEEALSGFLIGQIPKNEQQRCLVILTNLISELSLDIYRNEQLYPELKTYFDRERANYFKMKSEAAEAMKCD